MPRLCHGSSRFPSPLLEAPVPVVQSGAGHIGAVTWAPRRRDRHRDHPGPLAEQSFQLRGGGRGDPPAPRQDRFGSPFGDQEPPPSQRRLRPAFRASRGRRCVPWWLVAVAQAGMGVFRESTVEVISSWVGDTRRRCQNPRIVSTSMTAASTKEAMLASRAICPIFQNA
jgi:hypothetical protein